MGSGNEVAIVAVVLHGIAVNKKTRQVVVHSMGGC